MTTTKLSVEKALKYFVAIFCTVRAFLSSVSNVNSLTLAYDIIVYAFLLLFII